MGNKNQTLQWVKAHTEKILVEERIMNPKKPIRGVYGLFVQKDGHEQCTYVGRSENIYARMFKGNAHMVRLMKQCHFSKQLTRALGDSAAKIYVRVLKEVKLERDDYYKDMQRLASAECHCIDCCQAKGHLLEQVPEGTKMTEAEWRGRPSNP